MRITCPHCGPRGGEEFVYTQEVLTRPRGDDAAEWESYVYLRDNQKGPRREFWYHSAGCHAWLMLTRDVSTHEILKVELP